MLVDDETVLALPPLARPPVSPLPPDPFPPLLELVSRALLLMPDVPPCGPCPVNPEVSLRVLSPPPPVPSVPLFELQAIVSKAKQPLIAATMVWA
jgi:hypothetical protein